MMSAPADAMTLLCTDVEDSSAGWERHGVRFGEALRVHEQIIRDCLARHGGQEVRTVGDAFLARFDSPAAALHCAADIHRALADGPPDGSAWDAVGGIRVRIGVLTGEPLPGASEPLGPTADRAARICDAALGGMTLTCGLTARLARDSLRPGLELEDLGLHRLKDLGHPERLHLLREAGSTAPQRPRLRTLEALPHNFPENLSSFVGREREIRELCALLRDRTVRLLTLTGPGGTGKTRLALQVAAELLEEFSDGVWIVDLSPVRDPSAVPATIAASLGIPLSPTSDPRRQVAAYLRGRRALLVLDNLEQVTACAGQLAELLDECPSIALLATSRVLLRVAGEREHPVEPLSLPPEEMPDGGSWERYESVRLLVDRCRAVRPDFRLTPETGPVAAAICRRLDGMPLAIELAAARVRAMTLEQVNERLARRFELLASAQRDLPDRQRTLRKAIDWSYDLLDEPERQLFAELAPFVGGFFPEDAQAVCLAGVSEERLQSLREKSLLRTGVACGMPRFSLLESIREYASVRLQALGRTAELRTRHADHYLEAARRESARLDGTAEVADAMERMQVDIHNMRAGMDWCREAGRIRETVEYGKALARYFIAHNDVAEGDERLRAAEEACRAQGDEAALAVILLQRGRVAWKRSDLEATRRLATESLEISRARGDRDRMVPPLNILGQLDWGVADFAGARSRWEEALALAREAGQSRYEAVVLSNLALLAAEEGRLEEAGALFAESLHRHRAEGDQVSIAYNLMNSSEVLRRQGRFQEALERLEESRRLFSAAGYRREVQIAWIRAGLVLIEAGRIDDAETAVRRGLHAADASERWCRMAALACLGRIHGARGCLEDALESLRQSCAIAREIGERKHVAAALKEAGTVFLENGQPGRALSAWEAALREHGDLRSAELDEVRSRIARARERGLLPESAPPLDPVAALEGPRS